jgi:hypothetical protein
MPRDAWFAVMASICEEGREDNRTKVPEQVKEPSGRDSLVILAIRGRCPCSYPFMRHSTEPKSPVLTTELPALTFPP